MQFKRIKSVILAVLFLSTGIVAQDNSSGNRFSQWLVKDPGYFAKDFTSNHFLAISMTGFGLAAVSNFDEVNSAYVQKRYHKSEYLRHVNEFGTFRIVAPSSAALFGLTLLTDNKKLQDAAFTSFQAVLNTAVTVNISKFMFARSRPYELDGAYDFDFFHPGETSFPSGHASTAFALFVPWVAYYPNVVTYSLLAIPLSTSFARIAEGKHWLTDVTAGALIGSYWGMYLSRRHQGIKQTPGKVNFTPMMINNGGGGISISVNL
ncbi:MAG: phosphatase PAP2 family protein [Balneola sp.]